MFRFRQQDLSRQQHPHSRQLLPDRRLSLSRQQHPHSRQLLRHREPQQLLFSLQFSLSRQHPFSLHLYIRLFRKSLFSRAAFPRQISLRSL